MPLRNGKEYLQSIIYVERCTRLLFVLNNIIINAVTAVNRVLERKDFLHMQAFTEKMQPIGLH